MTQKKWLIIFSCISLSSLLLLATFNIWMDPFLHFTHSHPWNNKQIISDERSVKTNDFLRHGQDFDSVIFGSSVSTYLHGDQFKQGKVFNLAFSSFRPSEFPNYLNWVMKVNPKIKTIYLGIDFEEYYLNEYDNKSPGFYISKIEDPLYLWKTILSYSSFKYGVRNL